MCRVLEVSRSGYYAWLSREPSAAALASCSLVTGVDATTTVADHPQDLVPDIGLEPVEGQDHLLLRGECRRGSA